MFDTIIITVLGIIVVIQIYIINKLNYKLDMFGELHKYHNELVSITEKYINKEIDIVKIDARGFNYICDLVHKIKNLFLISLM